MSGLVALHSLVIESEAHMRRGDLAKSRSLLLRVDRELAKHAMQGASPRILRSAVACYVTLGTVLLEEGSSLPPPAASVS